MKRREIPVYVMEENESGTYCLGSDHAIYEIQTENKTFWEKVLDFFKVAE